MAEAKLLLKVPSSVPISVSLRGALGDYGRVADSQDTRVVTAVVKRYYQAAATGDDKQACAMLAPGAARSLPVTLGRFGPRYLRGARTCATIVGRLFDRHRGELGAPVTVNGVLRGGASAYAVLRSRDMPDSGIALALQNGSWMVDTPIAAPIPLPRQTVPWWLRTHPLGLAETRRLLRRTHLPASQMVEDGRILASYYGYVASPSDTRVVSAVVKRYYRLAAAGDALGACDMLASGAAHSIPVTLGRYGPPYLRGVHSCEQAASRMFRRQHAELSKPIVVTGVLTRSHRAYGVIDSPTTPDSIISLTREHGAWKAVTLLASPIPLAK